jgi:mRNA-degrading endonuclease RelE of RelBE toxin-antitoxin system
VAYTVTFNDRAKAQLGRLPRAVQDRMSKRAAALGEAPRGRGVKKLTDSGEPPSYRVWVGRDYRLLFVIDDAAQEVVIVGAGRRKDVYRRR